MTLEEAVQALNVHQHDGLEWKAGPDPARPCAFGCIPTQVSDDLASVIPLGSRLNPLRRLSEFEAIAIAEKHEQNQRKPS